MRTLIIEDEKQAISALKSEINFHCKELEIVGEAQSIKQAIEKINKLKPELIFLDIQLTDGLGFEILNSFKKQNFKVIFTTAYGQYAIKAIKFSALDYLLKPIDADELINAVQRAKEFAQPSEITKQFDLLHEHMNHFKISEKKIVLRDTKSLYFVKVHDILRCEASGSYTDFYLVNEPKITVSKALKEYENLLEPFGFIRTHHSHLVNVNLIKRIDKADGGTILLEDGTQIPVSQRKWEQVMKLLNN